MTAPSSAPARVLYLEGNTDGTIGGSYFSLLYLVQGLDRTRYEPIVVFQREHALLPQFRETAAVDLVDKPAPFRIGWIHAAGARRLGPLLLPFRLFQSGVNAARFLGTCVRYARVLRRHRADLLHLNNSITRTHDWMVAARLAGIPCVVHERGINEAFPFPTRQLAPRLAAVLCISQAAYDNLAAHGFDTGNLHVVHNGLDPAKVRPEEAPDAVRRRYGIAPDATIVGMVGNLRAWKGQDVLVRALPAVLRHRPNVVAVFIGEGTPGDRYVDGLHALVAEFGIGPHVVFTGYTRQVPDVLNIADVAVHASVTPEPFGRVLLEAMALRKPLVGSRGGAVTEIVVEGVTGYTFTPGDAGELAQRLIDVLDRPERARALGDAGYDRLVSTFHVRTNVERTMRIYGAILPASAPPAVTGG